MLDWIMIPIFIANFMNVFEGSQQMLNLYAETERPQDFFLFITVGLVLLSYILPLGVAYLGYLAFGKATQSTVLYNLPPQDALSITA